MNKELGEALSALMDGEADDQALQQVLDNVQDESLRDTWRRFHAASHGLQPGALETATDLSGRIMAAIEQEPAHGNQPAALPDDSELGESLSALMDGEADAALLDQVLDNIQDESLRDTWRRFHTASHGLQPGPLVTATDLSGRIMAAIEQESTQGAQPADLSDSSEFGESLSALMDGEAEPASLDQLLDNVQDPSLRTTWRRFHAASHGLQSGPMVTDIDLSGRIMAAIEQEPTYSAQPTPTEIPDDIQPVASWQRILRPVASFAVAASVFAVVLVGSQFYGSQDQPVAGAPVVAAGNDRLAPSGAVTVLGGRATLAGYATQAPAATRPVAPAREAAPSTDYDAIARERLERYMLEHADEASLNAPQGMMPYARVATFSTED